MRSGSSSWPRPTRPRRLGVPHRRTPPLATLSGPQPVGVPRRGGAAHHDPQDLDARLRPAAQQPDPAARLTAGFRRFRRPAHKTTLPAETGLLRPSVPGNAPSQAPACSGAAEFRPERVPPKGRTGRYGIETPFVDSADTGGREPANAAHLVAEHRDREGNSDRTTPEWLTPRIRRPQCRPPVQSVSQPSEASL